MKKFLYIILLLSSVFAGCRKEIEFGGDQGKVYVVVMAQLEPDSTAVVNLSYSRFFLDSGEPRRINDATMRLWVNGIEYQPVSVANGDYTFGVQPAAMDSVWFEAEVPGHGTIRGATRMVAHPQVANTIVTSATGFEFWRMMDLQYLQFDLTDPASTQDHYMVEVIEHDQRPAVGEDEAIDTTFFAYYLYMGDKEVGDTTHQNIFNAEMGKSFLISDTSFSGQERSICMMAMPVVDTMGLTQYDFWVRVSVYSPEMYKYRTSAALAASSSAMFAEPMQTYSNIKGDAIGIFASKSSLITHCTRVDQTDSKKKNNYKKKLPHRL